MSPRHPSNPELPPQAPPHMQNFWTPPPTEPQPPKKSHKGRIAVTCLIGGLVALGTAAAVASNPSPPYDSAGDRGPVGPAVTLTQADPTPAFGSSNGKIPTNAKTVHAPKPVSLAEQNAIAAAKDYLDMEGFSRTGLIQQLSSKDGDGYSKATATKAVNSIKVDWNYQAYRSAKQYLQLTHFSRNDLIQQLSSNAGDGYTHTQAVYAVNKVGL